MALVIGFAFLAVVALISLLLDDEDPRSSVDPKNDPRIWFAVARH